jgi:cytochrome c oxidase subunit 4
MMERNAPSAWHPPRILLLSWVALLMLLSLTVALAYVPLGALNVVLALAIAATKGTIVAAIFMALRGERRLTIVFAAAGFYWLLIMFWLTFADYTTRTDFPQSLNLLGA